MLRKNKPLDEELGAEKFQTVVGPNVHLEGRILFSEGIRIDAGSPGTSRPSATRPRPSPSGPTPKSAATSARGAC